jgi:hypothetical protein
MSKLPGKNGGMKSYNTQNLGAEWWESLSNGERKLLCSLMEMLFCAKQSQVRDIARAAAEWERGIGYFIKVRLMNGYHSTGSRRSKRKRVWITVEPVAGQKN